VKVTVWVVWMFGMPKWTQAGMLVVVEGQYAQSD